MINFTKSSCLKTLPLLILFTVAGCQKEPTVSFAQDVKPIIDKYCIQCHQKGGKGYEASGFSMETYTDLMQGTRNGPMVIAGDSMGSNMLVLMEGRADPTIKMPHGSAVSVSKAEIETVRRWIDQGAMDN
jgi:Planctomycete cytochrome C